MHCTFDYFSDTLVYTTYLLFVDRLMPHKKTHTTHKSAERLNHVWLQLEDMLTRLDGWEGAVSYRIITQSQIGSNWSRWPRDFPPDILSISPPLSIVVTHLFSQSSVKFANNIEMQRCGNGGRIEVRLIALPRWRQMGQHKYSLHLSLATYYS